MCALMAFVLPPETEEKVTLNVTVLVSVVFLILMLAENMPTQSQCIPVFSKSKGVGMRLGKMFMVIGII